MTKKYLIWTLVWFKWFSYDLVWKSLCLHRCPTSQSQIRSTLIIRSDVMSGCHQTPSHKFIPSLNSCSDLSKLVFVEFFHALNKYKFRQLHCTDVTIFNIETNLFVYICTWRRDVQQNIAGDNGHNSLNMLDIYRCGYAFFVPFSYVLTVWDLAKRPPCIRHTQSWLFLCVRLFWAKVCAHGITGNHIAICIFSLFVSWT